jgi:hypothetical protein
MNELTDHELSKIADNWAKYMPINTGIRTAFAQGYLHAMKQVKLCNKPAVSKCAVDERRELLIDCIKTLHGDKEINKNHLTWIDEYLKTIN